jgi:hypothetical protein
MITGATDRNHTSASGGQPVGAWWTRSSVLRSQVMVPSGRRTRPIHSPSRRLNTHASSSPPGSQMATSTSCGASRRRTVAASRGAVGVVLQVPVKVKRQPHLLRAACSVDLSAMKDEKTSILYPLTVLPRSGRVGRKHQERSVAVLFDLDDDFCHRSSSANAVSEGPEPVGRVE